LTATYLATDYLRDIILAGDGIPGTGVKQHIWNSHSWNRRDSEVRRTAESPARKNEVNVQFDASD
jgi:hypothetical protein